MTTTSLRLLVLGGALAFGSRLGAQGQAQQPAQPTQPPAQVSTQPPVSVSAPVLPPLAAASVAPSAPAPSAPTAPATPTAAAAAVTAAAPAAPAASAASAAGAPVQVRATIYGGDVVRTAKRYLGVRYRWGGATPKAFDCSGFVRYVFAQHGIALPRTAREQAAVGDAPLPGDLEPGDLLFFYGGRGAQHIAIYVGRDSIIHASSAARRVKFDRIGGTRANRTWFGRRLIAVRRVLPAEGVFRLPTTASSAPAPRPGPPSAADPVAAAAMRGGPTLP